MAREVGTEGKLGGQADVRGRRRHVEGPHRQRELHGRQPDRPGPQHRRRHDGRRRAATSSKKITVDVKGEILELKNTINTMVDQLSLVRRGSDARGARGRHRRQARRPGRRARRRRHVEGPHRQRELDGRQPHGPGAQHRRRSTTAVANGDLSKKITVDVQGEILELKNTINTMVDQLRSFASEVTRVAREVGTEGKLGGQADVQGVAGTWKDLTDSVNSMAGNLTGQVRNIAAVTTAVARRRPLQEDHRRREGRDPRAEEHHQHDGRSAPLVRGGSDARGARGRHRRQARRPGRRAGRRRHVEGPHRQRELHGRQPDQPGAQHRRGDHGRRQRRPVEEDHGRRRRARSSS